VKGAFMNNQYEIKLSFLQDVPKYNIFVLHLTSHLIKDGIRTKFVCDAKSLDTGHRQVLGIYAIPKKSKRIRTVVQITKIGMTDLQMAYQELEKIYGLVDIEGNDIKLYSQFKNEFYLRPIEDFDY
jgi:hypothetical protein